MSICCKTDISIQQEQYGVISYSIKNADKGSSRELHCLRQWMHYICFFPESQAAILFVKWLTIGSDHIFIPVEGFLLITIQCTCSIIVTVHVDVAVAFFQFCCRCTDRWGCKGSGWCHFPDKGGWNLPSGCAHRRREQLCSGRQCPWQRGTEARNFRLSCRPCHSHASGATFQRYLFSEPGTGPSDSKLSDGC